MTVGKGVGPSMKESKRRQEFNRERNFESWLT